MNREQKRNLKKRLMKAGLSKESAETFMMRMEAKTNNPLYAWEGKKVTLDYERLITYPDYPIMREDYKAWIEAHKDEVFTVEYDPRRVEMKAEDVNTFVQLAEDTTDPKWLWWVGDLIPLSGQEKPKTKEEEYKEHIQEVLSQLK